MLNKSFPTVFMAVALLMLAIDVAAAAPTFTVNSLGDAPADFTGDPTFTICRTNPGNSTCTLRAAIMNANRFAGGDAQSQHDRRQYGFGRWRGPL